MTDECQPMRWKCAKDGCFNEQHRLDFTEFYDALPGKISFTDVDAMTEVNGHALIMEWKTRLGDLPKGQHIAFQRITAGKTWTVLCVVADRDTKAVTHFGDYLDGRWSGWRVATNADVFHAIKKWAGWAQGRRAA